MPGFPDKFMPFMDEPPGATVSTGIVRAYGGLIRSLRALTNATVNQEPRWRHAGPALTTGYDPRWRVGGGARSYEEPHRELHASMPETPGTQPH
jgi:hydrogenase small subunit